MAQKCTEFADTREEGKALLKEIAARRSGHQNNIIGNILKENQVGSILGNTNFSAAELKKVDEDGGGSAATTSSAKATTDKQTKTDVDSVDHTPISFLSHQPQQSSTLGFPDLSSLSDDTESTPVNLQNAVLERVRQAEPYIAGNSPRFDGGTGHGEGGGETEDSPRRDLEPMNLTFTP